MKVIERLRFRWNNDRDPLPGEIEPTGDGAVIVWMSETVDAELSPRLRKLRGLVTGYGGGWTFGDALWNWLWPKLLVGLYVVIVLATLVLLEI